MDHEFDIFLSHAFEDKDEVVRPLADALEKRGLKVWFDEAILQPGDSLSSKIDAGLSRARYGVVILSDAFFSKNWPKYELSGLKAREINGEKVIIPIWHKIDLEDVLKFSPPLADMLAFKSADSSVDEIADDLAQMVNPEQHSRWLINTAKRIFLNLDKTEHQGAGYDYWPGGGLRTLYEHLLTFVNYRQFVANCPIDIWVSGPHTKSDLCLSSPDSFGHYNPKFVQWLYSNASFVLGSKAFVRATQGLYDRFLSDLVTLYYSAYQYLRLNPYLLKGLTEEFLVHLENKDTPPQHYWGISWLDASEEPDNPYAILIDRLGDCNRGSSAVYFWVRRHIDKTDEHFFSLLSLAFMTYGDYTNHNTFTDWSIPNPNQGEQDEADQLPARAGDEAQ